MSRARKHNCVCLEVVKLSIFPTYLFKFLGLKTLKERERELAHLALHPELRPLPDHELPGARLLQNPHVRWT